jgi:nicotinamidase/pyrazinamidase
MTRMIWKGRYALIVVDIQIDFCPGGTLPVYKGDFIVPTINDMVRNFEKNRLPIIFSRDFHPSDHISFLEYGGPWPAHCVKGTDGVKFHPQLEIPERAYIVSKATTPEMDAYSAFDGTNLKQILKKTASDSIVVCGLATDYCVKATVLDGIKEAFAVTVATDAVMGVEVNPRDTAKALVAMEQAGARLCSSEEVIKYINN